MKLCVPLSLYRVSQTFIFYIFSKSSISFIYSYFCSVCCCRDAVISPSRDNKHSFIHIRTDMKCSKCSKNDIFHGEIWKKKLLKSILDNDFSYALPYSGSWGFPLDSGLPCFPGGFLDPGKIDVKVRSEKVKRRRGMFRVMPRSATAYSVNRGKERCRPMWKWREDSWTWCELLPCFLIKVKKTVSPIPCYVLPFE